MDLRLYSVSVDSAPELISLFLLSIHFPRLCAVSLVNLPVSSLINSLARVGLMVATPKSTSSYGTQSRQTELLPVVPVSPSPSLVVLLPIFLISCFHHLLSFPLETPRPFLWNFPFCESHLLLCPICLDQGFNLDGQPALSCTILKLTLLLQESF